MQDELVAAWRLATRCQDLVKVLHLPLPVAAVFTDSYVHGGFLGCVHYELLAHCACLEESYVRAAVKETWKGAGPRTRDSQHVGQGSCLLLALLCVCVCHGPAAATLRLLVVNGAKSGWDDFEFVSTLDVGSCCVSSSHVRAMGLTFGATAR